MNFAAPETLSEQVLDADSAPIFYWDKNGFFTPYSTEEILANRWNGFKNWTCTAGVNSLFIHFEGIVFRGTCMVSGESGNIYDSSFQFPESSIKCPKDFCMCGGDIMVPKYKTAEDQNLRFQLKKSEQATLDPVAVTGSETLRGGKSAKRVIWSIGKRCNYDCSYCTRDVHSSTEPLKSKDMLLAAAEKLVTQFCRGEKTIFYIAGGEPTLYPGLVDLTKYLFEQGHECVVVSNGSTKTEIYSELIRYSHVCFSAHFEFLKEERFLNNINAMVSVLRKAEWSRQPIRHRLDVKLMTKPGGFPTSIDLAKKIYSVFRYPSHGQIRFNPLWHPDNPEKLFPYTKEESQLFIDLNSKEVQKKMLKQNPFFLPYQARGKSSGSQPLIIELFSYAKLWFKHLLLTAYNELHCLYKSYSSKAMGHSKRVGVQVWNAFYYNKVLRKPYYFFKFQYDKRIKKVVT